ncbi:hypothetical protein [Sphingomonas sp.]|uniref:hypothetical protein n=1 Tax=Sphingomonas sp. TaxID=28214 RepID=UPI003B00C8B0
MEYEPAPRGEELINTMAAGRPWWKLWASDIAPWIRDLPKAVRTNKYNRIEWIGRPWDGVSDIAIGEQPWDGERDSSEAEPLWNGVFPEADYVVPAADAALLVGELRRQIGELPLLGIALPDHRNVRACLAGPEGSISEPTPGTLTIDFDLGDMVLPLCIEYWQLRPDTATPMPAVARLMMRKLIHAARHRKRLLRRELRMRTAFEDIIGEIGDGAAPLWLRLEPLRFDDADDLLTHLPYVALDISLDLHQVWAPSGVERVKTIAKLQKMHAWRPTAHRRAVARLAEMHTSGSIGWITDVALALIEARGLNPAEVFRQERDASLHGGRSSHWGVVDHFGGLFCNHGILSPYFRFDGGDYNDGTLTIYGNFPHTLAAGAAGRPLAAFADHPAFVASGATVARAEELDGRLAVVHEPRLIPVEEAERRWMSTPCALLDGYG